MAGLYIHIPFCRSKCAYCDFYSLHAPGLIDDYITAVGREYACRKHEIDEPFKTIYIGGGTPSLLDSKHFEALCRHFADINPVEFTVEANPEDIDDNLIDAWKSLGVGRVSIGVQSLVDSELKAVGRRHSARRAIEAIDTLLRKGIDNISADLIYGLPGQTLQSWQYSLDTLLRCGITHLSAYCLSIEEGTILGHRLAKGEIQETDEDTEAHMYEALCLTASNHGFEHYEISNFALDGYRSVHNSNYWTNIPYLGLGPGAHSLGSDGIRRYVASKLRAYLSDPAGCVCIDAEDEDARINDLIFISLRTAEGLDTALLSPDVRERVERSAEPWLDSGKMVRKGSRLIIPQQHWLLNDAMARDLFI